ncbi:polyhydroxyalkanoic acid system family protein [Pacificimonas sp. WHA3]|uniref:Polyhydroxyalkanoic acid system family protein n=1 Tax=Pacificimonas pallii TaxID=2827236 RepID=A0ABS6SDQ7_9SPHN|nr:polyhydroxyalkanoic acid system family protein [Pacificimonas pallii]MBV7256395.1 polyhydroxyalkanoic acid system family protein [Pacificimonas pallii]
MEETFTEEIAHTLGRQEARRRISDSLPGYLEMLPGGKAHHHWTGDTMFLNYSALGQTADAQLEVMDDRIRVTVRLTGLLAAMGSKISAMLGRGAKELLEDKSGNSR